MMLTLCYIVDQAEAQKPNECEWLKHSLNTHA